MKTIINGLTAFGIAIIFAVAFVAAVFVFGFAFFGWIGVIEASGVAKLVWGASTFVADIAVLWGIGKLCE